MKSLLLLLAVLSAAIFAAGASAPTAPTLNAPIKWGVERPASAFTPDTAAGVDSITLCDKYAFNQGYFYVCETGPITGTAAATDSVKMAIRVDLYNYAKQFVRSITIDTIADKNGKAMVLPVGRVAWAPYTTVKAIGYGSGNGGQIIFPTNWLTIYKMRPEPVMTNAQ